jgi:plastocyanin
VATNARLTVLALVMVVAAGCGTDAAMPSISVSTRDMTHPTIVQHEGGNPDALYVPDPIRVHQGQTIIWTNRDQEPHDVTSESGLFASSPIAYGASWRWTALAHAPEGIEFLGLAPSNPNEVFGEVAQKGFVVSRDGGATWHPANAGIQDRNFSASTIRVAPSSPNVVYTGSWGVHFYASQDGGRHWKRIASLAH